jgi:hypothetical protein
VCKGCEQIEKKRALVERTGKKKIPHTLSLSHTFKIAAGFLSLYGE